MPWLLDFLLAWEAIETTLERTGLAPAFSFFNLVGVATEVALMKGPLLLIIPCMHKSKAVATLP